MNNTLRQVKRQYTFTLQDHAAEILGSSWPVSGCLRRPVSAGGVPILYNGERARYHVATCQSPWTCPVCSRRIMAGRKEEIENVLTRAAARGWSSLFLTVTLQHHTGSQLEPLLKALTESWRFVFSGDRSGERQVLSRVMAQIKTVEVRYGRNSWHPHLHVLLLCNETGLSETEAGIFEDELSECIYARYARKAEKLGFISAREAYNCHPVKIAGAAAHYCTKIEQALEMTSPETKEGEAARARSYTAFQLLSLRERGQHEIYGRCVDDLYREYATATKGKRQVSYSREIKQLLGLEEKPDEAFTEEAEEPKEERVLAVVDTPLWRVVCARKLRAALLDIADSGDEARVLAWLSALAESASIPIET